jgi:iron complex transport system ATP-binding protein
VILFRDVVIRYRGAPSAAVDGVSLGAGRGQLTAVVGPNGSGKSTLVRALIGRLPLAAGSIVVADRVLGDWSARDLATAVAVIAQREEPAFTVSAREYVELGRFPHLGDWTRLGAADRAAIESAVARTGVADLLDRAVDTLSGGEWQRVRLARALAQGGSALVLDEPTTFLDIAHEMAVFELLHAVAREGQAVLLVSHQLNLVARFADHLVLMHRGRVAAAGSPDDVMQASTLEHVYEWPLVVTRDPAVGAPALLPLRNRSRRR